MIINTNVSALNAIGRLKQNTASVGKSMSKLSSGLRINSASDDAAGLSISEKMRAQIKGLNQSSRNIQDAISLIQTADGGLNEIHSLLQRGRELSVQASNDTLTRADREKINEEVAQLLNEIDSISNRTEFNTRNLLNAVTSSSEDINAIITGLKTSWLKNSEDLIRTYYGLEGDGATLKIVLDQGIAGGTLAFVQGSYYVSGSDGKAYNQELHLELADFLPGDLPNGTNSYSNSSYGYLYNDRIIAHEMVHAIMGRSINAYRDLPKWFKEGTAEFIPGADDRLRNDIALYGVNAVVSSIDTAWTGGSIQYSAGYAAVKYMDSKVGGIINVMSRLEAGKTLDQAINEASSGIYTDTSSFISDFKTNGATYIATLNLNDTDVGAIGGGDAASVVPDGGTATDDPLTGFIEIWPEVITSNGKLTFHVGAQHDHFIEFELTDVDSSSLELGELDVLNAAQEAITRFNTAINFVSKERGRFGAMQNRLEHALAISENSTENITASESRIRDIDMSKEMMILTKQNILMQAAQAMLGQANQQPQSILKILA